MWQAFSSFYYTGVQCNLGKSFWRSHYYLPRNVIRTLLSMAQASENSQLMHSECCESDIDVTVIGPDTDASNVMTSEQDPDDAKQKQDDHKRKKKKCKLHHKGVYDKNLPRPNYFVGIKVCNEEIVDKAEKVQQHMVSKYRALDGALIALPTLHLTLAVMHLNEEDEDLMKKSSDAMDNCLKVCDPDIIRNPLRITFEGLGHFSSNVVFAKVKEGDSLNRLTILANGVRKSFESHGIPLHDKMFTPHLTLLKTSRLHGKWGKIKEIKKTIQPNLYEDYKEPLLFGTEKVSSLQLLSMNKEKDENGYYSCMKSISFGMES